MKGKEKLAVLGLTMGAVTVMAFGSSVAKLDSSRNAREIKIRETHWDIPLPGGEHLEIMNPQFPVTK